MTITDEQKEDAGFYEKTTGEKIELPLVDCEGHFNLFYLTTDQAAEYFAPELPKEETQQPKPGDNDNGEDNPPDEPQEPGDQTGDDTIDEEQPPQESTQPPEVEGTDNPGNTSDQDTSQGTQEPADNNSGEDNDYTPPADHRPSQRPTRPSTSTTTPADTNQPKDESAPVRKLVCGKAVIDTSRTIVLLGYGDGLLHEDDPLTRAQLATIVYRLLDNESIALYSNTGLAFVDVAADAWYAPYINVIQAAGIVNGVGGGKYDPNGLVCWNQILAILSRFVEPQEYTLQHIQYDGWAQEAIQTAVALEWIEDSADFAPNAVISRGELVQLVNSVLGLYRA